MISIVHHAPSILLVILFRTALPLGCAGAQPMQAEDPWGLLGVDPCAWWRHWLPHLHWGSHLAAGLCTPLRFFIRFSDSSKHVH